MKQPRAAALTATLTSILLEFTVPWWSSFAPRHVGDSNTSGVADAKPSTTAPTRMYSGIGLALALSISLAFGTASALSQTSPAPPSAIDSGPLQLFIKSIDLFTVLLVLGSIVSVAVIIQCLWEIRATRILPAGVTQSITRMASLGQWTELRHFADRDTSFLGRVVRAAMNSPGEDREAIRDAAELVASEECARWFRKIEPLNIVGNLGPLLGLAGTVWGMIIAFTSLGEGGGQANPGELALGISKALFHTLLGLLLAVPSLLVFGMYRTRIDRHCTRAMVIAAEIVEMIPASRSTRGLQPPKPAA